MKENRKLCVKAERYGTLDLWINDEDHWTFGKDKETKWEIIATYDGKKPNEGYAWMMTFDKDPVKAFDEVLGYIGRDTENWSYHDIVIHWGVHTWKFINSKNIEEIVKDEYTQTLEDIQMNYDVEWQ